MLISKPVYVDILVPSSRNLSSTASGSLLNGASALQIVLGPVTPGGLDAASERSAQDTSWRSPTFSTATPDGFRSRSGISSGAPCSSISVTGAGAAIETRVSAPYDSLNTAHVGISWRDDAGSRNPAASTSPSTATSERVRRVRAPAGAGFGNSRVDRMGRCGRSASTETTEPVKEVQALRYIL